MYTVVVNLQLLTPSLAMLQASNRVVGLHLSCARATSLHLLRTRATCLQLLCTRDVVI
jgi:hypothetical protein